MRHVKTLEYEQETKHLCNHPSLDFSKVLNFLLIFVGFTVRHCIFFQIKICVSQNYLEFLFISCTFRVLEFIII